MNVGVEPVDIDVSVPDDGSVMEKVGALLSVTVGVEATRALVADWIIEGIEVDVLALPVVDAGAVLVMDNILVVELPALSVAIMVMVLRPKFKLTVAEKLDGLEIGMPLIVRPLVAISDWVSIAEPETIIEGDAVVAYNG